MRQTTGRKRRPGSRPMSLKEGGEIPLGRLEAGNKRFGQRHHPRSALAVLDRCRRGFPDSRRRDGSAMSGFDRR